MKPPKYITFDNGQIVTGIIFDNSIPHDQMWNNIKTNNSELIGAGFLNIIRVGKRTLIETYGESTGLDIKSQENDTYIINSLLNMTCD